MINHEKETVQAMLFLYCRNNHHPADVLCPTCRELSAYALKRLDKCQFGEKKPPCNKCPIHCYEPGKRLKIIEVMRYAGPRMLFTHPIMAFRHLLRGLRNHNPQ